jgi:thioredoxin-dependent peroxiredoxin
VKDNAAFAAKMKFPFRLLCDTERALGIAYGACSAPGDRSAKRISYLIGPDGTIRHVFPKVDPKTHPEEALRLL